MIMISRHGFVYFLSTDPALYQIALDREISPEKFELLSNFYSGEIELKNGQSGCTLIGKLKDQLALSSLLTFLYELRHVILSVHMLR